MDRRSLGLVFACGLTAWIACALVMWGSHSPLGHDESQYALTATDLLSGRAARWNYVSVGMNVVSLPGVLLGGSERALRFLPMLLGIGFAVSAAYLALRTLDARTGAWVVGVLAATTPLVTRSADLLSDIPAAGCLLLGTSIVVSELTNPDGPRRRFVFAAPAFAAAFYVRYGSSIPIAVIGAVGLLFGWRSMRKRPLPVIAAVALFIALWIPHLVYSAATTGSALGILRDNASVLNRAPSGPALWTYLTKNPFFYYGAITTVLMAVGIASILAVRHRAATMLWCIAVGGFVAIGLTPVAQVRYLYFPIVLFVILGVHWIARRVGTLQPRHQRRVAVGAGVVLVIAWAFVFRSVYRVPGIRQEGVKGTLRAAAAIRSAARGAPCFVVCRHTTEIEWYSGCEAVVELPVASIGKQPMFGVVDNFGDNQPDLARLPGRHRSILSLPGLAEVISVE